MDTVHYILIAGYLPMAAAIAKLYRDLQKSQEARLESEEDHEKVLAELHQKLSERRRST